MAETQLSKSLEIELRFNRNASLKLQHLHVEIIHTSTALQKVTEGTANNLCLCENLSKIQERAKTKKKTLLTKDNKTPLPYKIEVTGGNNL